MRAIWILLLLAPVGHAQMADSAGDVVLVLDGDARIPYDSPQHDLIGLYLEESRHELVFRLETAALEEKPDFRAQLNVTVGGVPYILRIEDSVAPGRAVWANRDQFALEEDLIIEREDASRIIRVPKSMLIGADGTAGALGMLISVDSAALIPSGGASSGEDKYGYLMDAMAPGISIVLADGGQAPKIVSLASPTPTRVSNGAATTYAFTLTLQNLEATDQVALLGVGDSPDGWAVRLPIDVVRLAPGERRELPALVSVPFNHQHGAFDFVSIHATGEDGDAYSAVDLAVRYTNIPQPAGHHPTMWLHGMNPYRDDVSPGRLFFNAIEDDPLDESYSVGPRFCTTEGRQTRYHWDAALDPRLNIGLDFDLNQTAALHVPLSTPRSMSLNEVTAQLLVGGNVVATGELADGQALEPDEVNVVSLELSILDSADRVEFHPDNHMDLILEILAEDVSLSACQLIGPRVAPGGHLELPLLGYHDALPVVGDQLLVAKPVAAQVAPGSTVVRLHRLAGEASTEYEVRLFGHGAEYSYLLPGQSLWTDEDGTGEFELVVEVPADAADGQVVDLIVEATTGRSAGLLRTHFVIQAAGVDLSEAPSIRTPGKDSPLNWLPGVAALATLAWLRRR